MNRDEQKNFKQIGKILDAHGIRGDLYCLVFSGDVSWVSKIKKIQLVKNSETYLFEVKKIKTFKKGFILTLAELTNRNSAEEFKGAEVWVDSQIFISQDGESLYLSEILNFEVEDLSLGRVGVIESFSSNGLQDLLVVNQGESQYEIPFVKDFIEQINFKEKKIITKLPVGLLEINNSDEN